MCCNIGAYLHAGSVDANVLDRKRRYYLIRCKTWFMAALVVLLSTAVGPSNLYADIVNGDFEAGHTGFSSDYTYVSPGLTNGLWPEGTYTVDTNPVNNHSLWASFGDHTTGTGQMLIANGATTAGLNVWLGMNNPAVLTPGTYMFSAWVASVYPANPAVLDFKVNGTPIGSFAASTTTGLWQQFTGTFSTGGGGSTFASIDVNIQANGNDFALDDIHLQQVPDGGVTLMLLGGALVGVETLRRRLRS
jgi:hypothetical protein